MKILIVDDERSVLAYMEGFIKKNFKDLEVHTAPEGESAYKMFLEHSHDIVISDLNMPKMSGIDLCVKMKNGIQYPFFIMVTASDDEETIINSIHKGVDDFIAKPLGSTILYSRVYSAIRLVSLLKEKESFGKTDALTGLPNRRYLLERLEQEWSLSKRNNFELSIVMIDIDHFKRINDTFGHDVGDKVIRAVGEKIKNGLRKEDVVCRWGGEEFLLLIPQTKKPEIDIVGKKIVDYFNKSNVLSNLVKDITNIRVTVSVGSASKTDEVKDFNSLIKSADDNLYKAKELGRNMYVG